MVVTFLCGLWLGLCDCGVLCLYVWDFAFVWLV